MNCNLCPRKCNIDRSKKLGFCKSPDELKVSRAAPHFWEEPCISGVNGSGTVFFSGCNLKCVFCQNYDISHHSNGKEISVDNLLRIFDNLIDLGVHNINLVTPTHYVSKIYEALSRFESPVPVIYNCSGYESVESLKMLEGLIDIYLPDIKYFDADKSQKYSLASDYFEVASKAVLEMYRQVGQIKLNNEGVAESGIIVRHLVLPGNLKQTEKIFNWVSENLGTETYISLMRQYTPYGKAKEMPPLDRKVSSREYLIAKNIVLDYGFENCYFQQKSSSSELYIPDFDLTGVDV